jgi:branched-chain amino acid transport system ATP-binding protein
MTALAVHGLAKSFSGLKVITDLSMAVEAGERRLIIGPNGAGKTTLFNLISGELRPDRGRIELFGRDITALPSRRRPVLGLTRTFQIITLFPRDSLLHNVMLALLARQRARFNPFVPLGRLTHVREEAMGVLAQVGLSSLAERPLGQTSYGEQRRVELAMALAQKPKLMLLDEPFAGLSADERIEIKSLLLAIPANVTVVMIEHDMEVALDLAEQITVMHFGEIVVEGNRSEVVAHPRVREIYLGA